MCVLLLFLFCHILQHQALLDKCVTGVIVWVCVCVCVLLTFLARFHMDNLIHIDSAHKKVRAWPAAPCFSPQHFQMKTHQRRNIWISWRVWRRSLGGGVTSFPGQSQTDGGQINQVLSELSEIQQRREGRLLTVRQSHVIWHPSWFIDVPCMFPPPVLRPDRLRRHRRIPVTVTQMARAFWDHRGLRVQGSCRTRACWNVPQERDWTGSCRLSSAWETKRTRQQR